MFQGLLSSPRAKELFFWNMVTRAFDLQVYDYLTDFIGMRSLNPPSPQYVIESPIEKYLFIQIIKLCIAENQGLINPPFNGIFPQKKITISDSIQYIVDFVFYTIQGHKIAVELDGYEFHEKTKEQAMSDKERDRNLQQADYFVARFSGSEVYADPKEILFKIMDIAQDLDRGKTTQNERDNNGYQKKGATSKETNCFQI